MKSSAVSSISFGNTVRLDFPSYEKKQDDRNREVAKHTAEAGTAGFGVVAARNYAQKKGIVGKMVANAAERASQAARTASRAARVANANAKNASTLIDRFFRNSKIFAEDIMARLVRFKNNKFMKPIIESPLTKKFAGFLGGAFAFFVLITGLAESINNGKVMIGDAKDKIYEMQNAA